MVKLFNTLAREKQELVPLETGRIRMYVCGMTVYDYCHLGHARVLVVFDMVTRWLRESGYDVTYVRNVTDIDDKIIRRAAENGESITDLTGRFIQYMEEDAARLGVLPPTHEPRATQFVPGMIRMIEALIGRGLAYQADNGDVYYAVHRFPGYGKLSGKSLEDLRAGERVDVDPHKRDALDFVLWKSAKPGEPSWDSPWGPGRPGWHIECSVMSEHYLGEQFDIHGGGQDLQFPHHENEIAQSEGAHNHPFVNYWMHNGFVRVDNEKMSKSLGNFFTIREVLDKTGYAPEVLRFFILRAHYRSALNYSDQHLKDAKQSLDTLYLALRDVEAESAPIDWDSDWATRFKAAMDDDFDTHGAITVLFELANELNRGKDPKLAALLKNLGGILGLLQSDPSDYLKGRLNTKPADSALTGNQIEAMIAQRLEAKRAKNYGEADRIRAELADRGIVLEDRPGGVTEWRRE